jgi:uncharacterized membrane protein YhiD involved in acid resistance
MSVRIAARVMLLVGVIAVVGAAAFAAPGQPVLPPSAAPMPTPPPSNGDPMAFDLGAQLTSVRHAVVSLPLAAALGAALAFRPRRRGTPERSAPVIQTQLILAIVGAMVMLIVGASLARAFGIVGAASLVRYRAKVEDPKDAGVMLSTLAVGLASGVGLFALAIVGTLFALGVLWIVESIEPARRKAFTLTVKAKDPAALRPQLEQLLRRFRAKFELRTAAADEVCYEVLLPYEQRTDSLSNAIVALEASGETAVEWEEKKVK